jgi:serine phosphatase RsbU (regulator of sigma subunit)
VPGAASSQTRAVASPDYAAALDRTATAAPYELYGLIRATAQPLGARDVSIYLADFQGVVLQPILLSSDLSEPILGEEDVVSSMAGRAFRTGETVTAERDGDVRVWVPLIERGERTGVVAFTLAALDDDVLRDCERLGVFAGLLVRSFARATDLMHLRRRRRTMTLAAGMQWDLLPPLTVRCAQALACGRLEPAYETAGDAFDYAINDRHIDAAIFDGMGHWVGATMLSTLAVGAYRHARRGGERPGEAYAAIDEAVASEYEGEAFVTGILARLPLDSGLLEWTNAGHPAPLLLRRHRVVRELRCEPSLPFGLNGPCLEVATEQLEPGDGVLFFTDGMIEGRSPTGEPFGVERLTNILEKQSASAQPPEEILRRLVTEILEFNGAELRDDATVMLLWWYGPTRAVEPRP